MVTSASMTVNWRAKFEKRSGSPTWIQNTINGPRMESAPRSTFNRGLSDCCLADTELSPVASFPSSAPALARGSRGLFIVVEHDIGRGRLDAELAEHADDLAAVQRAVVHHVNHDLPGGKAAVAEEP